MHQKTFPWIILVVALWLCAGASAQNKIPGVQTVDAMLYVSTRPDPHHHRSVTTAYAQQNGCPMMPEIAALIKTTTSTPVPNQQIHDSSLRMIERRGYRSALHRTYNIPLWVSHALTREQLAHPAKAARRAGKGYPCDPAYPLLKANLYRGSGYDHGHLAPARDFKHDTLLYNECFYMSNMSPQHGCMNQKGWCHLEDLSRSWATESDSTVTYVVSGALLHRGPEARFVDTLCFGPHLSVYVPRYYYKALCVYNAFTATAKTIAFIVPNAEVSYSSLQQLVVSIDELEDLLGLDFFSALPDDLEQYTERRPGHFSFQPSGQCECRDKPCSAVYKKRETPATRNKFRCR